VQTIVENNYSRFENVFTFDILTTRSIPSTEDGGEVWVQYSLDYLLEEADVLCSSDTQWANGSPDCELWFDRIKVSGQTSYYSGELEIVMERIPNPFTEKRAGFVTVEIYDDSSQSVTERSYPNLNPNRKTYVYPGPVIDVNYNEPFEVERGTISTDIPISLDYPCALNMTLYP